MKKITIMISAILLAGQVSSQSSEEEDPMVNSIMKKYKPNEQPVKWIDLDAKPFIELQF